MTAFHVEVGITILPVVLSNINNCSLLSILNVLYVKDISVILKTETAGTRTDRH